MYPVSPPQKPLFFCMDGKWGECEEPGKNRNESAWGGSFFVFFCTPPLKEPLWTREAFPGFLSTKQLEVHSCISAPPWMICLAPIYTPGWRDVHIRNGSI